MNITVEQQQQLGPTEMIAPCYAANGTLNESAT